MAEDTISRRKALTAIADLYVLEMTGERESTFNDIFEAINALPSAQPERKTGRWIDVMTEDWCTFDECKCSVCGAVECFNKGWKKFSYCPRCGAKMEVDHET